MKALKHRIDEDGQQILNKYITGTYAPSGKRSTHVCMYPIEGADGSEVPCHYLLTCSKVKSGKTERVTWSTTRLGKLLHFAKFHGKSYLGKREIQQQEAKQRKHKDAMEMYNQKLSLGHVTSGKKRKDCGN